MQQIAMRTRNYLLNAEDISAEKGRSKSRETRAAVEQRDTRDPGEMIASIRFAAAAIVPANVLAVIKI